MHPVDASDLAHIWDKAQDIQSELFGARLFLTGGTGFFGCWILESIVYAKKHLGFQTTVTVLTRSILQFKNKAPHLANADGIEFIEGDVCDFEFPKNHFTHIIHAATEASAKLNEENPSEMLRTVVGGTKHVLAFAEATKIKKFLFVSSGAVYGDQPPELTQVSENYRGGPNPLSAKSAYGIGKCYAEHLCLLAAKQHHFDLTIARCFAFVGPHLPLTKHFAIGNFIHHVITNSVIDIQGDGSPFRSYLYAADLVVWLLTILCHGKSGEAYNVGSDEIIDIETLARQVAVFAQPQLPVTIAKKRDLTQLPSRYVPSVIKAKKELGLDQWIDLNTAIRKTIEWRKSCNNG